MRHSKIPTIARDSLGKLDNLYAPQAEIPHTTPNINNNSDTTIHIYAAICGSSLNGHSNGAIIGKAKNMPLYTDARNG